MAPLKYVARSFWWDTRFRARHVFDRVTAPWARASPSTYSAVRTVYRRLRGRARGDLVEGPLPPRGTVVSISGIKLRLHEYLSDQDARRIASGRHTKYERRLILDRLAPDDVVMELGGGVGMLAIACARKIGSARVYSFEANPMLEALIRDNCQLNGVAPHFEMCMLGREAGTRTFYVSKNFGRSSVIRASETDLVIQIPVKSVNEVIARIRPTCLIVDVQGDEDRLLEHIDCSGLTKVAVEFHPDLIGPLRVNELRKGLREKGYVEVERQLNCILYVRSARATQGTWKVRHPPLADDRRPLGA